MKAFHYFVSHGMGWATGANLEEAMRKAFCTSYYGDMGKWLKNIQKQGEAGIPCFTCRVPLADDVNYSINFFVPQMPEGVKLEERQNRIVTWVTQKNLASMRDPNDRIRELEHEVDMLRIELVGEE